MEKKRVGRRVDCSEEWGIGGRVAVKGGRRKWGGKRLQDGVIEKAKKESVNWGWRMGLRREHE